MYEITIQVREAGDASELVSMIVRSSSYDHVQGVCVARVGQGNTGLATRGFEVPRSRPGRGWTEEEGKGRRA